MAQQVNVKFRRPAARLACVVRRGRPQEWRIRCGGRPTGAEDDRELRFSAAATRPGADRGDPGVGSAERPRGLRPWPDCEDRGGRLRGRPLTQATPGGGPERKAPALSLVLVAGHQWLQDAPTETV